MRLLSRFRSTRKNPEYDAIEFDHIATITPEKNRSGNVKKYAPYRRYRNKKRLPLNRFGKGPFCRFRIPNNLRLCGVYFFSVDKKVKYVGECKDLSQRFNAGYGNIAPRACYVGGQSTNCRINNLVFQEAKKGKRIELWFRPTKYRKWLEAKMIRRYRPEWNIQLKD